MVSISHISHFTFYAIAWLSRGVLRYVQYLANIPRALRAAYVKRPTRMARGLGLSSELPMQ